MTKKEVERLAAIAQKAQSKHRRLVDEREYEIRSRLNDARARITSEVARVYDGKINDAFRERFVTKEAFEKAREEYALAGASSPYPLGTRMLEWKNARSVEHGYAYRMMTTGRVGIVEVFTRESPLAKNTGYHAPQPGDVVLRVLKKAGDRSLVCYKIEYGSIRREWFPEGIDPNERAD